MRLQSPELLKSLMARREMSLGTLARYAGCSKSFVSHLTGGRKKTCTPRLAERIAEALDVPLDLLFVPSPSATCGSSDTDLRRAS